MEAQQKWDLSVLN
ncbi:unnamed protein product, partial [Rotaria sp. Silwood1]